MTRKVRRRDPDEDKLLEPKRTHRQQPPVFVAAIGEDEENS
jgi:hypothetical protein